MQTVGKMQQWQLAIIIYMKFGGEIRRIAQGVVLEIATINVAVEFAGCARLVDADAIMLHLVLVGRTGGLRKGRRGCAHAQDKQGQQRPNRK